MCGICGFTGQPEQRETVIRNMTEVITHRGPDADGFYTDDAICMGFRRLSIIDLDAGHQPIFNEDKTMVLTFNGEIYNYKQLREALEAKGHAFATESDSEVLIHGFEEWKEEMLPRLRGMFAFAIYNIEEKSLFLARDAFGIKPLHYTQIGNDFVYASEIKSILEHPNFEKRFNKRALDTYLSFQYALPPETFFEDVYCLLPGHYLWYKNGSYDISRYFEPRFRPDEKLTEEEAVDLIEKAFENSINAHKIADVEVGCFLSSGVDSSYVSTYFSGQKTFTVGFDFGEKYNEISWAETVSKLIDVDHHTHLISSEEFWDAVPTVQYYMDQPLADPSCVALYFVSRLASQYVKVVLSGEGADELFGGYTCYNDPRVFRIYQRFVPHFLRKGLRAIARKLPDIKGRDYIIRACDPLEERYIGNAYMYDLKQKKQILKDPSIATAPERHTRRHYYRCRRYDDVTKMQYLDINLWMTGDILLKADRMSMANSLELRVPFLDREMFKVASKLPTELRVNKSNTKYALRKAAARHLPETTAEKEKLGFPVPTREWLKDEKYYNIVKQKFQSETAEKFFNTDALVHWLDEHYSGKEDNSRRVWTIYVFLVWYDIYFNEKQPKVKKPVHHLDELQAGKKPEQPAKTLQSAVEAASAFYENSVFEEEAPAPEQPAPEQSTSEQPAEGVAEPVAEPNTFAIESVFGDDTEPEIPAFLALPEADAEEAADEPAEEPAKEAAAEPLEGPAAEATAEPVEENVEGPVEEPAEETVEETSFTIESAFGDDSFDDEQFFASVPALEDDSPFEEAPAWETEADDAPLSLDDTLFEEEPEFDDEPDYEEEPAWEEKPAEETAAEEPASFQIESAFGGEEGLDDEPLFIQEPDYDYETEETDAAFEEEPEEETDGDFEAFEYEEEAAEDDAAYVDYIDEEDAYEDAEALDGAEETEASEADENDASAAAPEQENVPELIADGAAEDEPELIADGAAEDVPELIADGAAEDVPELIADGAAEDVPELIADGAAEDVPELIADGAAEDVPELIADGAAEDEPELIADGAAEGEPEAETTPGEADEAAAEEAAKPDELEAELVEEEPPKPEIIDEAEGMADEDTEEFVNIDNPYDNAIYRLPKRPFKNKKPEANE